MSIIVLKDGRTYRKISRTAFKQETDLQNYVQENPDCIPLYEIKENVQFSVLLRELPLNVGSIDIFGVDSDGDLYIIETKFYKNPDKRQVLAQVLDYGACLWESFGNAPELFTKKLDQILTEKTGNGLRETLESIFSVADDVIEGIERNVSSGNFYFIILMDSIHKSLRDLILFMNKSSQFSIYAVELEHYKFDNYDIIIPHIFGAESKKISEYHIKRKKWDRETFFRDVKDRIDGGTLFEEAYEAIEKLYEFSLKFSDEITWGTGATIASFSPKFYTISRRSIYTVRSDGIIYLNFGYLNDTQNASKVRDSLKENFKKIKDIGTRIPNQVEDRLISLPIETWYSHIDDILSTLKTILNLNP